MAGIPEGKRLLGRPRCRWDVIMVIVLYNLTPPVRELYGVGWMMNWKGFRRKRWWPVEVYYPDICLMGRRKR
jgi:hypothetical protein